MKGLLWVLALFALAVGISLAVHVNDGYVLLVLPPYRAEISFNLAILLGLLAFVVFHALLRGAALTLALPRKVRDYRARQVRTNAQQSFEAAVRLLCEGRGDEALQQAAQAHACGYLPALSAVVAARAAHQAGNPEKRQEWLALAVESDQALQPACLLLESEAHLEAGRFADAVASLERLPASSGLPIAARRLMELAQRGEQQSP